MLSTTQGPLRNNFRVIVPPRTGETPQNTEETELTEMILCYLCPLCVEWSRKCVAAVELMFVVKSVAVVPPIQRV